ncbi:MAG TPA: beta-ketoacyl-[acyl-carrier-protein] synthase family protein [Chitinolyticbacter sp.]|nr:beta-ketoacyl-[acyl-carrier-protein] synthase family protein [Chitinolyticbacter sp.]
MTGVYLHHVAAICSLGADLPAINQRLFNPTASPLLITDAYSPGRPLPLGVVADLPHTADTRNNSLLRAALAPIRSEIEALKQRFGARRIAVVLGSSTSGIAEGEAAIAHYHAQGKLPDEFHYRQQELSAPSTFVAAELGLTGPAWTVSTACTSGAKAIASGARLLQLGVCDAVIVGGADSLCKLTVEGFLALAAVSDAVCTPFSRKRKGINIGEAAALMVLSREPGSVRLVGAGETSDAHHISAPEPEGRGAEAALRAALTQAGLSPAAIGYLNLHGTATEQNDRMESLAVARVFGEHPVACSSTKPLTGHTLGAAGALEAVFCYLALMRGDGRLPPQLSDGVVDPQLPHLTGLGAQQLDAPLRYAMSNSFAFGGNNISLILERCHD